MSNHKGSYKEKRNNRIGEERITNFNETARIIEYEDSRNATVLLLETGEIIKKVSYQAFQKGSIIGELTPTLYGVGVRGRLETRESKEYCYRLWTNILTRCYNDKYKESRPTYKDVSICEEWKYYQNFKKWFYENYYEVEGERTELDKDILKKGNKIYSPNYCVFVPQKINGLFTKRDSRRGELPIGVSKHSSCKGYVSTVSIKGKNCSRCFHTIEEAFEDYKARKELEIKRIAEEYRELIPIKLYEAMYRYEVNIDD